MSEVVRRLPETVKGIFSSETAVFAIGGTGGALSAQFTSQFLKSLTGVEPTSWSGRILSFITKGFVGAIFFLASRIPKSVLARLALLGAFFGAVISALVEAVEWFYPAGAAGAGHALAMAVKGWGAGARVAAAHIVERPAEVPAEEKKEKVAVPAFAEPF